MNGYGVYVGRFSPIHLGHERVLRTMIQEFGVADSLILVGSANTPVSLRHFFSYKERKMFIRELFPQIQIAGIPDFGDDSDWLDALDDLLVFSGRNPQKATFFGGCEEDVRFFIADGRKCRILNRFTEGPKISATEVRDHLIHNRQEELTRALNPLVLPLVTATFEEKWEVFKKM